MPGLAATGLFYLEVEPGLAAASAFLPTRGACVLQQLEIFMHGGSAWSESS